MNPCRCGYFPDLSRCRCTREQISRYLGRISQPLLDRIDICVEAPQLRFSELAKAQKNESSKSIRERVMRAHKLQRKRFYGTPYRFNSQIPAKEMERFCPLGNEEMSFMERIYELYSLTARTYHKLLRVARTIADLDGKEKIELLHLKEAVCYRTVDKRYWDWQ